MQTILVKINLSLDQRYYRKIQLSQNLKAKQYFFYSLSLEIFPKTFIYEM